MGRWGAGAWGVWLGWHGKDSTEREDWKMKFMDEVEMWYKRNSQESPSIVPDKTTPNSAFVV